ncbi:9376_t:CDS:1 [Funneliformis mosseae]|uniref:9376_t:CDS:1 n=1 Tax=Funneliformis mosseae TaxID=27381 RepID=A0A9N9FID8_FUNMO|nr:9376_t:CDS:1 [Funneliformis mosseae]
MQEIGLIAFLDMNCLSFQRLWVLFSIILLSLIIVGNEANSQVQENPSINLSESAVAHLQCPYVRALSEQKKEKLENESSNITKTIFSYLFPGSPRVNSLLGTLYISSIPNFILYFVPPDIKPSSLNSLVSFAVGGLLGDVFLHLLPHSFLGENNDEVVHFVQVEEQKNVVIGLAIFVGLTTFFVIDKLMRVANGEGHSHAHYEKEHEHDELQRDSTGKTTAIKDNSSLRKRSSTNETTFREEKIPSNQPSNSIKLSAYLNLIADATHNFTDGLAMAASFYTSPSIGATTTVAVFFHEIPHEIGDYAILIQSGFTKRRAMLSQFITAIGAFLGTLAGIAIEEYSRGEHHINNSNATVNKVDGILGTGVVLGDLVIPFTAGGFLYIATVGVIPELLNVTGNLSRDIKQAATEFFTMFIGVSMMAIIAWNEGA